MLEQGAALPVASSGGWDIITYSMSSVSQIYRLAFAAQVMARARRPAERRR